MSVFTALMEPTDKDLFEWQEEFDKSYFKMILEEHYQEHFRKEEFKKILNNQQMEQEIQEYELYRFGGQN